MSNSRLNILALAASLTGACVSKGEDPAQTFSPLTPTETVSGERDETIPSTIEPAPSEATIFLQEFYQKVIRLALTEPGDNSVPTDLAGAPDENWAFIRENALQNLLTNSTFVFGETDPATLFELSRDTIIVYNTKDYSLDGDLSIVKQVWIIEKPEHTDIAEEIASQGQTPINYGQPTDSLLSEGESTGQITVAFQHDELFDPASPMHPMREHSALSNLPTRQDEGTLETISRGGLFFNETLKGVDSFTIGGFQGRGLPRQATSYPDASVNNTPPRTAMGEILVQWEEIERDIQIIRNQAADYGVDIWTERDPEGPPYQYIFLPAQTAE